MKGRARGMLPLLRRTPARSSLNLAEHGGEIICQKDAFLCAASGIDIDIAFSKKLGAGLFGGEGFILQRLSGDGMAFMHAGDNHSQGSAGG